MFRDMGYHTSKICPAVAPLKVSPEQVKGLKGVRVYGCVSAVSEGKVLKKETGEIQFQGYVFLILLVCFPGMKGSWILRLI